MQIIALFAYSIRIFLMIPLKERAQWQFLIRIFLLILSLFVFWERIFTLSLSPALLPLIPNSYLFFLKPFVIQANIIFSLRVLPQTNKIRLKAKCVVRHFNGFASNK